MRKQVFSRQHFVRECSGMLMCLMHLRTPAGRLPVFEHHRFRVSRVRHVIFLHARRMVWSWQVYMIVINRDGSSNMTM
jgi:hypothetical protein